jgi:hypothetical protein
MYRDFEHRLAEAEGAPCAAGSADSASRMHATRVSNLACPSICAIEAIDFLLLQVRPRLEIRDPSEAATGGSISGEHG